MTKNTWIKLLIVIFAALLMVPVTGYSEELNDAQIAVAEQETADSISENIQMILEDTDLEDIEKLYESAGRPLGEKTFSEAIKDIAENGLSEVSVDKALASVFETIKNALLGSGPFILEIVIIVLMFAVMKNMNSSFSSAGISDAALWVCYTIIAVMAAGILTSCASVAKSAIETLSGIIDILTPAMTALLTAVGGIGSSALLSPVLAMLTGSVFELIRNIVFPAILVTAVLNMVTGISGTIKLSSLADMLTSAVKWSLGTIFIIYLGISALKGLSGGGLDGISIKTAKYTIDKMVPVIGGMFSDTLDTIFASGLIIKNAVGIGGLIIIGAAMSGPLAALAANSILLNFGAGICESFCDNRTRELLKSMGMAAKLMFLAILTCVSMAFISVALFIGTANMAVMMR